MCVEARDARPKPVLTDYGTVPTIGSEAKVKEAVDELSARRRFNALVVPHVSALRARAGQLCRSNYDSDDIVQEAMLRAYRAKNQVTDQARMRAWLLTILTRAFIDVVRRRQRQPESVQLVIDNVPDPGPDEASVWDAIGVDDLRAAIERLPDDVRDTYRMFALEGCDYVAISAAQQIPIATVGTRMFRARKRLRILLTASGTAEAQR